MKEYNCEKAHFETAALHAGQTVDSDTMSRSVPVFRTSSFLFKSAEHAANLFALKEPGYIYTRIGNPTQEVLERRRIERRDLFPDAGGFEITLQGLPLPASFGG